MKVGVPRELKAGENRVALVPAGVAALAAAGHTVLVERRAGVRSGVSDRAFADAGAKVVDSAEEIWHSADLIVKVKEPIEAEYHRIRDGQVVFCYFHFAADSLLTQRMLESGCVAIAYETVELASGELPLLTPMSEVAGRVAVQKGANYLEQPSGGRGTLLGAVPGVLPAHVAILGGGVVGANAATVAAGLGARVTILDVDLPRLRYLSEVMPANVRTLHSNRYSVLQQIERADMVVGAVLVTGAKAPKLVLRDDLRFMKDGSVIVDVAIDQGGCVESARPTTHDNPVYAVDGVIHYCVSNIPSAVPHTSTLALTNATLPYVLSLANQGWVDACRADPCLGRGVNVMSGALTCRAVAEAFELEYQPLGQLL